MLSNRSEAYDLLSRLGASPRLILHVQLVGEVADMLIQEYVSRGLVFDRSLIEIGVALHDAGKILHPSELDDPGSLHEPSGRELLLAHDVRAEIAQCCVSHASWGEDNISFEELTVALSDKLWKGKRVPELELLVIDAIALMQGLDRWYIFSDLDDLFERIASQGVVRLRRSMA